MKPPARMQGWSDDAAPSTQEPVPTPRQDKVVVPIAPPMVMPEMPNVVRGLDRGILNGIGMIR